MKKLLNRIGLLFRQSPDRAPLTTPKGTGGSFCHICGMDHETGIWQFKKGDKVEVISGVHDGAKGRVIDVDYRKCILWILSGEVEIEVIFERVLNLTRINQCYKKLVSRYRAYWAPHICRRLFAVRRHAWDQRGRHDDVTGYLKAYKKALKAIEKVSEAGRK